MNRLLETDFFPGRFGVHSPPPITVRRSAAAGTRRILIVDNDSNTTHLVKVLLERSGPYLVFEENDATEAYQTARSFKPDLILLDLIMRRRDGAEIAEQIHADRDLNNTPIIFQTGLVTTVEAKSGVRIDGHPIVAKPINIPELIDAIEKHLPERTECEPLRSRAVFAAKS